MQSSLVTQTNDHFVRKTTPDSFLNTNLQNVLNELDVDSLIVCGYASEFCVDTTIRRAAGLGYPVTLVSDAHTTVTGIDLGLSHFAIESNGKKTANPRYLKRAEKNLKRKQRQLSRKKKGSANRGKARLLVAKCHEKVVNARADFQHKLSRTLVDKNHAVIVETLKSANMMKNHKLAKHIADASWHSFVVKLEYKLKEKGKHLVKVDQLYASSKTCHCCGHKMEEMPLSVRKWDCPSCGTTDIDRGLECRS